MFNEKKTFVATIYLGKKPQEVNVKENVHDDIIMQRIACTV